MFKNKNLPVALVREIISMYEEKELELKKDEQYNNLKASLVAKQKIDPIQVKEFIDRTKNSIHTNFYVGKSYYCWTKSMKCEAVMEYDLKYHEYIYINLLKFTEQTYIQFKKVLIDYKNKNYLIVNLENNTGGDLRSCLKICRMLINKNCEIVTMSYNDKYVIHKTYMEPEFQFKKIYIIVNKNTASSSEILALALRTNMDHVMLLGTPTFCKEVGQENYVNRKYKYVLSLTSYRWSVHEKKARDLKEYIIPDTIERIYTHNLE